MAIMIQRAQQILWVGRFQAFVQRQKYLSFGSMKAQTRVRLPSRNNDLDRVLGQLQKEVVPESHIAACPHAQHQVIPGATHALTNPSWDDAIINWFADRWPPKLAVSFSEHNCKKLPWRAVRE